MNSPGQSALLPAQKALKSILKSILMAFAGFQWARALRLALGSTVCHNGVVDACARSRSWTSAVSLLEQKSTLLATNSVLYALGTDGWRKALGHLSSAL